MPKTILLPVLLLWAGATGLHAQTDYYARIGAIGANDLLRDVIVSEIPIRQSIAPLLALGASVPISPGYRVGLEGQLASGGYHSTENDVESDLGTLRTGSVMLLLEGPIAGRTFRWRAGGGLIKYWPSERSGMFLQGGPARFLAGAGADYRRPALGRWDFMASLRYDFHRFTTDELERRGFSHSQSVNRVSLSVGLARSLP
jgi:hypothetical protein